MNEQICRECNQLLPLDEFYQIKSKHELNVRYEKVCKVCKRNRKRLKYRAKQLSMAEATRHELLPNAENLATTEPSNGEAFYKSYTYPDGSILNLTKDEFDSVVDVFRMLLKQDQKLRGQQTT